jgi:tetratricopeptide (TPR) repeat protein
MPRRTHAHRPTLIALLAFSATVTAALAQGGPHDHVPAVGEATVPLFEGVATHHFPVTTTSDAAQAYVDQGLMFVYGFDHFEAARSFEQAVRLDPTCAMCHWGLALALGPHINAAMAPEAVPQAYAAITRALELAPSVGERERAYIEALAARYAAEASDDRTALDRAYADAMRELVAAYPDDLDAATLFAEALMNLVPWNYWDEYGEARAETAEFVAVLESVMSRDPDHPGANHHYIHAVEASPSPERAEGAADRLVALDIPIGHMIHMPAHIFARVGRWHDASTANERAIVADRAYLGAYEAEGLVPLLYHPHNVHFLSWTAGIEGRAALALDAARELVEATPPGLAAELPFLDSFLAMPLLTMVRFEMWDEILAEPVAADATIFGEAVASYARGRAGVALSRLDEARADADALAAIATSDDAAALELPEAFFPGATMLAIMHDVLEADIAALQGDDEGALRLLERAVAAQDALPYMEPPYWFVSARLDLADGLMRLGRFDEAEAVYLADLQEYPENGWALFGLAESRAAQGDAAGAEEARQRFEQAWRHADVSLAVGRRGVELGGRAN